MKAQIILFLFCISTINLFAQTSVSGGTVSGNWTLDGSPYLIQGSIMVANGSTLSIDPGVTVNFQGSYKMLVLGRVLAIGTSNDSITFTANNTSTGWRGIRFNNTAITNDSSKFSFCRFQYGKATGASPDDNGGAFYFNNFSKAIISHSRISNCAANNAGGGIYCSLSSPIISNNIILNNIAYYQYYYYGGGAIECISSSCPVISNNIISNNTSYGYGGAIHSIDGSSPIIFNNKIINNIADKVGGGIYSNHSTSNITNNTIYNNIANNGYYGYGGGAGIESDYGNDAIINNLITNNLTGFDGGGIFCESGSPTISNNTITNNSATNGGGIFCGGSNSKITNNTISNNNAAKGGALFCSNISNPTLYNCIIWGNNASSGAQVFLNDELSDPPFYYCDIQGGINLFELNGNFYTGTYQNNINTDPLLVSPSTGNGLAFNGATANWSIQLNSPCIDAGDPIGTYATYDIVGNSRINNNRIDIGAYEFQGITTSIHSVDNSNILYLRPSIITNYIIVETLPKSTIDILNTQGQVVKSILNDEYCTTIDLEGLSNGIYIVIAKKNNEFSINKFVK